MKRTKFKFTDQLADSIAKETAKEAGKIGCGVLIALIVIMGISLFLSPLLLMLTWNLAICALFPTLPLMSYWVAFGINIFLGIIGGKFKTSITQNFKDYFD